MKTVVLVSNVFLGLEFQRRHSVIFKLNLFSHDCVSSPFRNIKNLIEPVSYFIQTILSESLDEEYKHIVCMLLMLKVVVCNDNQNWNAWQQKIEKIELESTGM